jgi:hypothetical protein
MVKEATRFMCAKGRGRVIKVINDNIFTERKKGVSGTYVYDPERKEVVRVEKKSLKIHENRSFRKIF